MEVHHRVQQSLPLVYNFSQINPVNVIPSIFCDVHFNTILPSMPGSSEWSPSVRVPHQTLHTFLPIHPTCSHEFDHPTVWWECSFYTFYSSSCYLWNWISDIKWWVGRIEQINERAFVHSVNTLWSCVKITACWDVSLCGLLYIHIHQWGAFQRKMLSPSSGWIHQCSIILRNVSTHVPVYMPSSPTRHSFLLLLRVQTLQSNMPSPEGSNLTYKVTCPVQLLTISLLLLPTVKNVISNLQYICQ